MDQTPFFTNDTSGFIKLVLSLAGTAVAIIGAVWKMMQGPLRDEDKRLQTNIDGVGQRVTDGAAVSQRHDQMIVELHRRADNMEREHKYLRDGFTRVEQQVTTLTEQSNVNKTEIIDMFQRKANEILERVHAIDKELYAARMIAEDRKTRDE
jgi:TolA-binding protein